MGGMVGEIKHEFQRIDPILIINIKPLSRLKLANILNTNERSKKNMCRSINVNDKIKKNGLQCIAIILMEIECEK